MLRAQYKNNLMWARLKKLTYDRGYITRFEKISV